MDVFGPLPTTNKGNPYILVVQDTYTKHVELYPLPRTDAPTLAECLLNQFITRHGVPTEILSDNGPPFSSTWLQTLWSKLGSQTIFSPAYHAFSNGQVEVMMRTVRTMVASYCDVKVE
jgi:transposase InsO family protein